MIKLKFILLLTFLIIKICLTAQTPDQSASYLNKFNTDYITGMMNNKPETIVQYYAIGIRLMPEFQKTIIGKTYAQQYHQSFFERFVILAYTRSISEIIDLGSKVAESGKFNMTLKLKSSGKQQEIQGKYFCIWDKQKNSTLSLNTETWNYDHHLENEDQMRFQNIPVTDVALQSHVPVNSNVSFELAALNRLMETTVSQHDAKIWSQFYTEDAIILHSHQPASNDKKEQDAYLKKHVTELPDFEKLDIRNDRIDHLGKYIIEYASHIAIWKSGESSGVGLGKDLRIWRREQDGSLKIFRHIGMYD
ncbi:MAG: nuclear transport factor 2 family protein [Saprospiraceae bacterium]